MLSWLRNLFASVHNWIETDDGMHRHCKVCGQQEERDLGGMQGSMWMIVERGNKAAHVD